METHTISAAEFKAKCLGIMDEVAASREPVIITKRGKPVARLVPIEAEPQSFIGRYKGKFKLKGDLVAPVFPAEEWDCFKE